jgi:hypothetical protein
VCKKRHYRSVVEKVTKSPENSQLFTAAKGKWASEEKFSRRGIRIKISIIFFSVAKRGVPENESSKIKYKSEKAWNVTKH